MDLLSVGSHSKDVLLSETGGLQNEIELLSDFCQKPSNGGFSPPYSVASSADSGISSPFALNGEELFAELFGEDLAVQQSQITGSVVPHEQSKMLVNLIPSIVHPKYSIESGTATTETVDEGNSALPIILSQKQEERNRKNAVAARINRQKKKEYVSELESSISSLRSENTSLKSRCSRLEHTVQQLETEVQYLKSVLVNQSSLSTLLQNIPGVSEVRLSSSLARGKHVRMEEPGETGSSPAFKRPRTLAPFTGGVCLHVAEKNVSIEFCSHCSADASLQ